jgi:hypothetical protein
MRRRFAGTVGLVWSGLFLCCDLLGGTAFADDKVLFENLGLPSPLGKTRDLVPEGFRDCPPGSVCKLQLPAVYPRPLYNPELVEGRIVKKINVADDEVGIFNASGQPLAFSIEVPPGKVTLKSNQIKTFDLAGARSVKAAIQTGGTPSHSTLDSGSVYIIEASGGNWVFKKF